MKKLSLIVGFLMIFSAFAGLAVALDPLDGGDAKADPDRDGLKNLEEFTWGTDPTNPDSDGAGCFDGWEVWYETHRAVSNIDTGEFYISDSFHFDPNFASDEGIVANPNNLIQVRDGDASVNVNDPDNDGWNNLHEFLAGADPTNPNTDQDSYTEDSSDPDPLVSNDDGEGGGGNGGNGSGEGEGEGEGSGSGSGSGSGW